MFITNLSESVLQNANHIHFIGIGGSGMYPLVQILHAQGKQITGSDNNYTDTVADEEQLGASVIIGQKAENIAGADLIVFSAAIMPDNPELVAAKESLVPAVERSALLGLLSRRFARTIGVCGTHGKTTSSSMLTQILMETNLDPSAILGGKLEAIGGSGRAGKSDILVIESCEYVDTFLKISPWAVVILNIDEDHMEYFKTSENLIASFRKFADSARGPLIINGDDEKTCLAVKGLVHDQITFGKSEKNDYTYTDLSSATHHTNAAISFKVWEKGNFLLDVVLHVPGEHNALNALSAIASARLLGVSPEEIQMGLSRFHGAKRRFEVIGEIDGVTIADDYAHHPTEVEVTLNGIRMLDFKEIWVIFQPFTFSRTAKHLDAFAKVLSIADHVLLTPIMGSREKNTYNIFSEDLAAKIPGSLVFDSFAEIGAYAMDHAKKGDLIITMGCGDVYKVGKQLMDSSLI